MAEAEQFPKWKYHATKKPVVVNDAEAEATLGEGWYDHPDQVGAAAKPAPPESVIPEPVTREPTAGERDSADLASLQRMPKKKRWTHDRE